MNRVRPTAVAGVFYPADATTLLAEVRRLLEEVPPAPAPCPPVAVIVPHAGFRYSGPVAACAYARLAPLRARVRTVVLVGPAHYGATTPIALSSASAFDTPLGPVPVDRAAVERVLALPGTRVDDRAHEPEHCLEVQLPFLLATLGDIAIVPVLAEPGAQDVVAALLETLWNGPDVLPVVSSDLSHYLSYEAARTWDRATADAIEALDGDAIPERAACGCAGVRALLGVARSRRLRARTVDLRSSGDTAGDRQRVVGYGAFVVEAHVSRARARATRKRARTRDEDEERSG